MKQLNQTELLIIGAVVVAAVYLYLQNKKKKEAEAERATTIQNSEQISQGTGSFNPKPFAERIKSDLGAYTADTSLYEEMNKLNSPDIRAIWQYYDTNLKDKDPEKGKTLGLAIYDSYAFTRSFTFGWDWDYYAGVFYNRLNALGLP